MNKLKKSLFLLFLIFVLSGCSNTWKNKIEILSIKNSSGNAEIDIRNKTDNAFILKLLVKYDGMNDDEYNCTDKLIKPQETKRIVCKFNGATDENDIFEIKDVNLLDKEIPVLEEGFITVDTLNYYFESIYEDHVLLNIGLPTYSLVSMDDHPFITKISYEDKKIVIFYEFNYESSRVNIMETYNSDFEKMESLVAKMTNPPERLVNNMRNHFSSGIFGLASGAEESSEINSILHNIGSSGKTYKWNVSSGVLDDEEGIALYYIMESRY